MSIVVCLVLVAHGCDDRAEPLEERSERQGAAQVTRGVSMSDDEGLARVLLIDRHPRGVIILANEQPDLLLNAVDEMNKEQGSIESMQIIAWTTKALTAAAPPRLHEEVVVLVAWGRPTAWSLCYVEGDVRKTWDSSGGWEPGQTDFSGQTRTSAAFDDPPSEEEIVEFVRAANFGNNEFSRRCIVGTVALYEHEYHDLLELLQSGIPRGEREARRRTADDATADPQD